MGNGLADALNLDDVRELARQRLPPGFCDFIDRSAEDDFAADNNREALRKVKLTTRALTDASGPNGTTTFFGSKVSMPVAIAPTGAAGLVWVQGELELAKAAAAVGIPFTIATRSMTSIEDIAAQAGGTPRCLGRPIDVLVAGGPRGGGGLPGALRHRRHTRSRRTGNTTNAMASRCPSMRAPRDDRHGDASALAARRDGEIPDDHRHVPYENQPGESKLRITEGDGNLPSTRSDNLNWDDIKELRRWARTLVIKGILRPEDTRRAVDCGADGVVVSNHGGRCLDAAVAPIDALPGIADAIGGRSTVLMDGDVRRSTDIAKALALGASGVLMGRPGFFGTALAGEAGAQPRARTGQTRASDRDGAVRLPSHRGHRALHGPHRDAAGHLRSGVIAEQTRRKG